MIRSRIVSSLVLAGSLAAPAAFAQADNSNSQTFPDRLWIALFAPPPSESDQRQVKDRSSRWHSRARKEES